MINNKLCAQYLILCILFELFHIINFDCKYVVVVINILHIAKY